jgi:RNA polymerase sigma-70 factor (sigma-E family)
MRARGVEEDVGANTTHDDFTEFVHATGPRLYRSALLLTGDPHLAEDLLQTTYTRLFASWRRVQRAGNPVAYARTTLTNVFLSHRRVRRNSELPTDELPEADSRPGYAPEDRLDLLTALRGLPPVDRTILVLRYWEDRSVGETAAALHLSESAVRTRASRALAQIRPHLNELQEKHT